MWKGILCFLLGWSTIILAIGHYTVAESAQRVENIERLSKIKVSLELEAQILQNKKFIKEVEVMVDSINKLE